MSASKIKKGDSVVVRSGRTRAAPALSFRSLPRRARWWFRASMSPARHRKPSQTNPQGGIDRREAPIAIARSASPIPRLASHRVRFETKDGSKVRVAVKSGETIDG